MFHFSHVLLSTDIIHSSSQHNGYCLAHVVDGRMVNKILPHLCPKIEIVGLW